MLIKTIIKKIISKEKISFKSTPMYFTDKGLKSGREHTETRLKVIFECENGKTYFFELSDGRKANAFYEGKEIWGMEDSRGTPIRLSYYWWTKDKFLEVVKVHIQRDEESILSRQSEIVYLKTLI